MSHEVYNQHNVQYVYTTESTVHVRLCYCMDLLPQPNHIQELSQEWEFCKYSFFMAKSTFNLLVIQKFLAPPKIFLLF